MADPVLDLTPAQHAHLQVMRAIADGLVDTPLVLKGGSALIFAYGLDRFSTDLDFDSAKKLRLETRIRALVPPGVEITKIDRPKDTDTMTRYRVEYRLPNGVAGRLKIEVSYRDAQVLGEIRVCNGIRTYSAGRLIEQKLAAASGRTSARDLSDLAFLAERYSEAFTDDTARKLHELTADIDALDARYRVAFERDKALRPSRHDSLESVIIRLMDALDAVDRAARRFNVHWPEPESEDYGQALS